MASMKMEKKSRMEKVFFCVHIQRQHHLEFQMNLSFSLCSTFLYHIHGKSCYWKRFVWGIKEKKNLRVAIMLIRTANRVAKGINRNQRGIIRQLKKSDALVRRV
jgi:hypothetical protein